METKYIFYAIPAFFILMAIEFWVGWREKKEYYSFSDTITNLNIGIGNQILSLFFKVLLLGVYTFIYHNWALFNVGTSVWAFVACLLLFDLFYYWSHRWGHEINFLWGSHVVHHSSEEYNLAVALRQPWFGALLSFIIFIPFPLLGFSPALFFVILAIDTLYQFWIHTKAIKKLPKFIELIFNTPSHHRVHHAVNLKYLDKNYGGIFIVWDRIFGTFIEEEEAPTYGITQPLNSWNPVWANFHYFVDMYKNIKKMSTWRDKLWSIVARPGWLPSDLGGYQKPKEVNRKTYSKYHTNASFWLNSYVLIQFILINIALTIYIYHFETISVFYKVFFLIVLLLSTLICGAILENKKWVGYVEYLRLCLVLISLNSYYYFWYADWLVIMLLVTLPVFALLNIWFTTAMHRNKLLDVQEITRH